jgi:fumarate reductase subunit C
MGEEMSRRPYVREIPRYTWFFRHPRYMRYMAREITCIFIGAYTLILLCGLAHLSEGQASYEAFLQTLASPGNIVFQIATLILAVYHTVTWFNVTPKALPVQIGEEFVPNGAIAGAHYAGWVVLSAVILLATGVF